METTADELYMMIGVLYVKNCKLEAQKQQLIEAFRLAEEARNQAAADQVVPQTTGRSRKTKQQ